MEDLKALYAKKEKQKYRPDATFGTNGSDRFSSSDMDSYYDEVDRVLPMLNLFNQPSQLSPSSNPFTSQR